MSTSQALITPEFSHTSQPKSTHDPATSYVHFKYGDPEYAGLLRQFFRLRKSVFIDELGWELSSQDGMEIDQYDQASAEYILQVSDGVCVGGCRLMPTTSRFEVDGARYSYMLRDARLGRLAGFPEDASDYTPVSTKVWELTRVISQKNPIGFRDMMEQVRNRLKSYDVDECLFITRTAMLKICRFWGYDIEPVGPELAFGSMKAITLNCQIAYFKDSLPANTA